MNVDIDFDAMLEKALSKTTAVTDAYIEKYPELKVSARQMEMIRKVTAQTVVDLLREYHSALVSASSRE